VFDAIVPGLAIRVSASGRKTFTLYYRHRRRMRRIGLGRYPDVLLEEARKIATQHRGRIFDGADPAGEKQTEHAQDENPYASASVAWHGANRTSRRGKRALRLARGSERTHMTGRRAPGVWSMSAGTLCRAERLHQES
jgi:hypothetical protein